MSRLGRSQPAQRGVALLMVLGLIALLTSLVTDFVFTSRIDVEMAYNSRDGLQAEYNALSALRLRALILKQSRKVQTLVTTISQAAGMGSSVPPIGQILEMLPVECGLLGALIQQSGGNDDLASAGDSNDFFPGECMATSENEHSKIAINLLGNPISGANNAQAVTAMLMGLLSTPELLTVFRDSSDNPDHVASPLELIRSLADWIDPDHTEIGTMGDEDHSYQYLKNPYRTKNAPFDSVAELQLVHGIDDRLFNFLRPHVTIYNTEPGIEVSTAPVRRLVLTLATVMRPGTPPEVLLAATQTVMQTLQLAKSTMTPINVALIQTALTAAGLMTYLDPSMFGQMFKDGSSVTWHTIFAQGQMGHANVKMRAVFQAAEGTFYYFRQE